ncbi:MAG: hypothetical protein AAGE90_19630 [Pseudomonadota bacterium]
MASTHGRFAIIGWGSLIWDMDGLERHVTGDWAMGAGPALPLEFSRVSAKRLGGLAVCIDPEHGVDCPSHVIASRRGCLLRAAVDLARRERAPIRRIGIAWPRHGMLRSHVPGIGERFAAWCEASGWEGAVWTDLDRNFEAEKREPFGVPAAERHLAGLTGASRVEAVRYIEEAPRATDTPLRRHLAAQPWWQAAVREVLGR